MHILLRDNYVSKTPLISTLHGTFFVCVSVCINIILKTIFHNLFSDPIYILNTFIYAPVFSDY